MAPVGNSSIKHSGRFELSIPWDNNVPKFHQDGFRYKTVKADAWNAYFPYQLVILQDEGNNKYTVTPWRYTLPVPPQELQVSMPVADRIEATLGGYNETFGGAPFRNISFSGTMGVLPEGFSGGRDAVNTGVDGASFITAYTAPLLSAVSTLATGGPPRVRNQYQDSDFPDAVTGFYMFHQLRYFLEGYLAIKGKEGPLTQGTSDDGDQQILGSGTGAFYPNKIRLAFCMWRDQSVYLCRLVNFEMRRDSSSPLEYRYSLQLQAYKRVNLNVQGVAFEVFKLPVPKKNLLTDIMNRIDAVRKIVAQAANLANLGIVGPLALLSELSRQVSGIVKDALSIPRSLLDMPATFIGSVLSNAFQIQQQAMAGAIGIAESFRRLENLPQAVEDKLVALGFDRKGPSVTAATGSIQQAIQLDGQPIQGGVGNNGSDFRRTDVVGNQPMNDTNIDPNELLLEIPELANVDVQSFPLTAEQRDQLNAEIAASSQVNTVDIDNIRVSVQQSLDSYTQTIGSWNSFYSDTYGLPATDVPQRDPTREELDIIFAVNDFLQSLDAFTTHLQDQGGIVGPTVTSIEYIAGLAERSGMDFGVPTSKYAVPFPYNATLERVAQQYLGDANRWNEIAVLNGLRAPYIDEVGFQLPLLVNGNEDEVVVGSADNLFIGQPIWLSSNVVRQESRRIVGIRQSSPTTFVLTLSGEPDLERFTTNTVAVLNAYLPGTVNSKQAIYIPSDSTPDLDEDLARIPGVDPHDPLLRVGGIDWLLTPKLDLVVTPYGDNPLAIGLTSLTQAALVAFKTTKGNLQQHPNWGLGLKVGSSVADFDMQGFLRDLESFFNEDPALAGLQSADIRLQGNTLLVTAQLGVRGLDRSLPILLTLDATR